VKSFDLAVITPAAIKQLADGRQSAR